VIHGSDSVENGKKEIALWFGGESRGSGRGEAAPSEDVPAAAPGRRLCGLCAAPRARRSPNRAPACAADLCEWTPAAKPWIYE
jgi:hypothetical protein